MCRVAINEGWGGKIKPQCVLLHWAKDYLEEGRTVDYHFRFNLKGKIEKAVRVVAKINPDGSPIVGSAVNSPQDIDDPEIKERAQAELDYWLKRTAKYLAWKKEKRAEPMTAKRDAVADKPSTNPEDTSGKASAAESGQTR